MSLNPSQIDQPHVKWGPFLSPPLSNRVAETLCDCLNARNCSLPPITIKLKIKDAYLRNT